MKCNKEMKKILMAAVMVMATTMTAYAYNPEDMVYNQVARFIPSERAAVIAEDICNAAYDYGVDPILAAAVFTVESNFNQNSVSRSGAIGIAQLMPDTAAMLGVDPHDEESNVYGGVAYLAQQLSTFGNDYVLAEAAYNAGPGAVEAAGGVPYYTETIDYVNAVESVRQEIWNAFGDTDDYQTPTDTDEDDENVISSPENDVKETIRVWPPIEKN